MSRRLWEHPAIAGLHVVSMTRDYPDGVAWTVATCQCGWTDQQIVPHRRTDKPPSDAVDAHWRDVIAKAEGALS